MTKIWVEWELETGWSSSVSLHGLAGHIGGSLNVAGDLAGQTIKLGTLESIEVIAEFPQPTRDPRERTGRGFAVVSRSSKEGETEALAVHFLIVKAWLEVDRADPPEANDVKVIYERASRAVGAIARGLMIAAAIQTHDFGLEPPNDPHPANGTLFWGSSDLPIRYPDDSFKGDVFHVASSYWHVFDRTWLETLSQRLSKGWQPFLHWLIFAEATRLLLRAKSIDQAIVSAVTATEVGLNLALIIRAKTPSQLEEMAHRRKFDFRMRKTSQVVLGESFAEARKLDYEKIDRLVKARNAIVHEGKKSSQTIELTQEQLESVRRFLDWIDLKLVA
jgi:hypothetical protein